MKKFIGVIFLLLIVGAGLYGGYKWYEAQYLEDGAYMTTRAGKNDAVWRMPAVGEDPRVYEFTPETGKHMQCTVWSATNKAAMACWPKQK